MKTFEKIIGAVLFTALLFVFISSVFGMAEQSAIDGERSAYRAYLDELDADDGVYISPSDKVIIEIMEERHE